MGSLTAQAKTTMAPEGATGVLIAVQKNFGDLGDSRWGILPFHKLDITRIAELAWKFRHPAAGYTDKIDILELGLAYVTWVR